MTPFVHVWSMKTSPTPDRMSESDKQTETNGISRVGHDEYSNVDIKMRETTRNVIQHDHSNGMSRTTFIGDKNNPPRT